MNAKKKKSSIKPATADSTYLLVEEAADLARTSMKTIRHWILIGKLPTRKPGRRVLIRRVDLMALIEGTADGGTG